MTLQDTATIRIILRRYRLMTENPVDIGRAGFIAVAVQHAHYCSGEFLGFVMIVVLSGLLMRAAMVNAITEITMPAIKML